MFVKYDLSSYLIGEYTVERVWVFKRVLTTDDAPETPGRLIYTYLPTYPRKISMMALYYYGPALRVYDT